MKEGDKMEQERMYNATEVAKILGVSGALITKAIKDKRMKGQQLGCFYCVSQSEVDRLKRDGFPFRRTPKKHLRKVVVTETVTLISIANEVIRCREMLTLLLQCEEKRQLNEKEV